MTLWALDRSYPLVDVVCPLCFDPVDVSIAKAYEEPWEASESGRIVPTAAVLRRIERGEAFLAQL